MSADEKAQRRAAREKKEAARTIIPLFDGYAIEAMHLNWVVCRENPSKDAPERWTRIGYYSSLGGVMRGAIETLIHDSAQARQISQLHQLLALQAEMTDRITRALMGAVKELANGQRIVGD